MSIPEQEIVNLNIGDIIYECQYGENIEVRLTSNPVESPGFDDHKQWSWTAENTQNGEVINYLVTENLSHYGPRLYRTPQYCRIVNGVAQYKLYGAKKDG